MTAGSPGLRRRKTIVCSGLLGDMVQHERHIKLRRLDQIVNVHLIVPSMGMLFFSGASLHFLLERAGFEWLKQHLYVSLDYAHDNLLVLARKRGARADEQATGNNPR